MRGGHADGRAWPAAPTRERHAQGDQLVHDVGAVFCDAPDPVERHFEGQENAGRGDEQHDDGGHLDAAAGMDEQAHVADDEVLVGGQNVAQHTADLPYHGRANERSCWATVNIITMKGKMDRMVLAATLKA